MKKSLLPLILNSAFLILNSFCFAQNRSIDSLLTIIKSDIPDSNKVIHLITLCNEYRKIGGFDNGLKCGNEALALSEKILSTPSLNSQFPTIKKGRASTFNNIANIYYNQGNYPEALKNYFASLKINDELKNKKDIAGSYHNIGIIYYFQNNYPEALKNYFAALNIRIAIGDKQGIATTYNNIGTVYDDPENYPDALKNYFAALKIYDEIDDRQGIAGSYTNIGRIYNSQGNYPDALKMYFASLKLNEELLERASRNGNTDEISKVKNNISFSYNNLGNIYWNQVNYPVDPAEEASSKKINPISSVTLLHNALKNYLASLKIREGLLLLAKQSGNSEETVRIKQSIAESFINLGTVQMDLKKLKDAQDYLNKALLISKETGSKEWIKESYSRMEELDSIQGLWKAAYQHHKLFILYKDSIDNEEIKNKSVQSAMLYDFEKQETATIAEQDKKQAVEAAEIKKQKIIIGLAVFALLLLIAFAGFIFRSKNK